MKVILYSTMTLIVMMGFFGCGSGSDREQYDVSVYSIAPVLRAVVQDASGQIAIQQDMRQNRYTFSQKIVWPITVTSDGKESYIDVDFNGVKSGSDIALTSTLYSNSSTVSELTTRLLQSAQIDTRTLEFNQTRYDTALREMARRYSVPTQHILNATPMTSSNKRLAMLNDALFQVRQNTDYNLSNLADVDAYFNIAETFYTRYLEVMNASEAARYYESLVVLELIDAKRLAPISGNVTPKIPAYLNHDYNATMLHLGEENLLSSSYNSAQNLAYWDIAYDADYSRAYVAAGNDGFDLIDTSMLNRRLGNYEQNISGFGIGITYFDRFDNRCIAVASLDNEILFYAASFFDLDEIVYNGRFTSGMTGAKAYDVVYASTNAHNRELLLVAGGVAGLQVIDMSRFSCQAFEDLNASNVLGASPIGTQTYGVAIANNRKIIYIADGSSGVRSVDISGASPQLLDTIALQHGTQAYKVHLASNSSELYVSTDTGIEIISSDDTGRLVYKGYYATEGSRANALGETVKVDRSRNAKVLFVADVTGGLKILDVSESSYPRLCGAAYFQSGDIAQRSAVRDVKLDESIAGVTRLYIANDANGLIMIDDARTLLFEHCKGLLD